MIGIEIRLEGEVAFENYIKLEEGYRCDVPTDELGIPFLPLIEILKRDSASFILPGDMEVGFARPDGYLELLQEAGKLCSRIPNGKNWIRSLYTEEHFNQETGTHMRSLKSGQTFYAPLHVRDENLEKVAEALQNLAQIGVTEQGITGEVRCSLCKLHEGYGKKLSLSSRLSYCSLDYSMVLLAPASLHAPYEDGDKTYFYIPGAELRKALLAWQTDDELKASLPEMRFSNAYIGRGETRLLPVPACMSVVKLDREQLRYRLSPGKDPTIVEQDVGLENAFGTGFDEHFMQYAKPIAERVTSSDGTLYDALSEGQVFKGTIYGTDEQLRRMEEWIRKNPFLSLGALREEGYGQAYIVVDALRENRLPAEALSSCFDVGCMSHTLLYTEEGMPGTRPEDLLRELEYVTGLPGAFEIVGKYTNVYMDYADRFDWNGDGPVTRCLKMGSVLRIRTKDGKGADISPILHTFIGENTGDGYGEIMAWPATDAYYRITKELTPGIYNMAFGTLMRDMHIGARRVHNVLTALLKRRVTAIGEIDSAEVAEGKTLPQMPVEVLAVLRDTYDPELNMDTLESWYRDGLSGSSKRNLLW